MKIQVVSDLHQEFGISEINFAKADLVIFAGDTNLGTKGIQWIQSRITSIPVIYVLGNHEYYKGSYPKTLHKIIQQAAESNIHVLENESIQIDDITFHGATLWTDFRLFGNSRSNGMICQDKMNDYKMIRRDPAYSKLRSVDTFNLHMVSVQWLEKSLASSYTDKNVVVTHHAPSARSIPLKYKEDVISTAYASDLEEMIRNYQPDYWIHGHVHEPVEYMIGNAKILCNPHGYIDEPYNGFNKELIIDL